MFARQFTANPTSYCDVLWNSFFSKFVVSSTTSVVSQKHWHAAKLNTWKLRDKGHTLPWNDMLIATLAIDLNYRVYAKDKHFELMAQHLGLRLYEPGYGGRYEPDS